MIARGTGYIRGAKDKAESRLVAHFRYLERESATAGTASGAKNHLFTATADQIGRKDAVSRIMKRATLARVRYHKVVLSPAQNERVLDWQAWTRSVMAELQRHLGTELTWTAILHTNTAHPHIHVVLAGSGADTATGRSAAVRLHLKEYELLRKSGLTHSEYDWHQLLRAYAEERDDGSDLIGALLPGEGRVGRFGNLSEAGMPGDGLTAHHVPSALFMEARGIEYDACVAINVEQPDYGAGRHRMTRTYGWQNQRIAAQKEMPRDALARDIRDLRRIYATQGQDIRQPLQEVIAQNKLLYPHLFKKGAQDA
jgi:hypothetical protein